MTPKRNSRDVPMHRPRDIARLGLIKNSTGGNNEDSNYFFILNLIKTGRLKARNYGSKSRSYWLVSEDEIERYKQEVNN
jgi:hypothetical protein